MKLKQLVGLVILVSAHVVVHLIATPVRASELDTMGPVGLITIDFEKVVHFDTLDGDRIVVQPGRYVVEAAAPSGIRLIQESSKREIVVAAQNRPEAPTVSDPTALAIPWQEDALHVVLIQPAGPAREAIGSLSGVRSRATAVLIPAGQLQQRVPLGIAPAPAQMAVVASGNPLTAPPTAGWQYQTLFPSDFQALEFSHQVQGTAGAGTTDIPNPPAKITASGLTWPMGDDVLAAIHLSDGTRVQEVLCVFDEAPFQSKDGLGQVTTVPLGLGIQIRKQKVGDPVNAPSQQLVYASLPNAVRTGVSVLQAVAPPNQAQPIQNHQFFYVLSVSRYYQGIVPVFNVPPMELRGCRIGYTLQ